MSLGLTTADAGWAASTAATAPAAITRTMPLLLCLALGSVSCPSRCLPLGDDQLAIDQRFGDLDGVECRALAQVVGHHPHCEPVLNRRILADAADIGGVLAGAFDRRHVAARLALVDHQAARRIAQDLAR